MWSSVGALVLLVGGAVAQVAAGTTDFAPDENPRYFPVGVFAELGSDGDFKARWFATQLRALKEPSLLVDPGAETVYRFTWLRTFDHPVAVRIVIHANGSGTLTVKMADGAGGYAPGKLIVNSTREMDAKEIGRVLGQFEAMGFWQMPTPDPPPVNVARCDGAEWIFEGSRDGRHHVVVRWSPEEGALRNLGLYLALKLGRLDVPRSTIY